MISLQDIEALIELALRAPKSRAENIWLVELVAKVKKQLEEQPD